MRSENLTSRSHLLVGPMTFQTTWQKSSIFHSVVTFCRGWGQVRGTGVPSLTWPGLQAPELGQSSPPRAVSKEYLAASLFHARVEQPKLRRAQIHSFMGCQHVLPDHGSGLILCCAGESGCSSRSRIRWEWVRGIVSSDDTLLVATSAGPAYVMTVLSVFSWQWLTLSTASCPTPRLEKVELFLRRPIKDNLTSLVVALPVQRTCGDCKQNMIATPPRSVDSELWLKGPLQIGNRAAMGPDGIVNLFLQYVFRPLDHLLHSKDRYSPRFAFLAPVATPFNICRKALNTHGLYPWPACPAWSFMGYCSKCPGASAYWCVECDTRLCAGCAARLHHPGLYSEHHSVEPLEKRKTQVLGLLMSNLLVISFAVYMISSISIGPDYLSSADMCPVITKARSVAASVDSKVFYYYKADLTRYCNMEDSFYKFFLDGWVRGIVTSSDDTLLAATSAGPAYVMTTVLSVFLVPVAASIYAALMAVAHFV
ncbi:unnamed protein product, partial [Effrenium voratum]